MSAELESHAYRRGLIAKTAFVMLILAPLVTLSAAAVWFCVSKDKPLPIAASVVVACFLLIDHFAYHTFCEIVVTPEGLLYRGGGVLWRKFRRHGLLAWSRYIYKAVRRNSHYIVLLVTDKDKVAARYPSAEDRVWPTLTLYRHVSAPFSEFNAFVNEILLHNPEAKVISKRPRESPGAVLVRRGNLSIVGDREFRSKTIDCLELLEERDPVNYRRVRRYIQTIKSVQSRIAAQIDLETRTCEVNRQTKLLTAPDRWYASTIVRQMCCCMLHHRFGFSAYNPRNNRRHQEICLRAQMRSLRRLGAAEEEVRRLENAVRRRLPEP